MGGLQYRVHQRFLVDMEAKLNSCARAVSGRGRILDLGIGGAACELDQPFRIGEQVELHLASNPPRRLVAHVTWIAWAESSAVRLGVRFDAGDFAAVGELLDWLGVQDEVGSQ